MSESTNFFDDSFSQKESTKSKSSKKDLKEKTEKDSDKKKLKIVKQALLELRKEKEELAEELQSLRFRNQELEKEN
jgi:hypothetical protein